ncbi:MAG: hypothetical protein ACYCZ7_00470 [Minisyncoccota bacterium]
MSGIRDGFHLVSGNRLLGNTHQVVSREGAYVCVSQEGLELRDVAQAISQGHARSPEDILLEAEERGEWSFH